MSADLDRIAIKYSVTNRYTPQVRSLSKSDVRPAGSVISLVVRELSQLFDSMKPSPFYEKDLDRNADEYIVASARELPRGTPIALVLHLERLTQLANECQTVGDAIRVHFGRRAQLLRWELRQLLRRGWISLVIGILFLALALLTAESVTSILGQTALASVIHQGLLIGGWVALWRPIEILLYDWWPVFGERRILDRLSAMPVRIVHAAQSSTHPAGGRSGDAKTPSTHTATCSVTSRQLARAS